MLKLFNHFHTFAKLCETRNSTKTFPIIKKGYLKESLKFCYFPTYLRAKYKWLEIYNILHNFDSGYYSCLPNFPVFSGNFYNDQQ